MMKITVSLLFVCCFIINLHTVETGILETCTSPCPLGCICSNDICSSCEVGYTYDPESQGCKANSCDALNVAFATCKVNASNALIFTLFITYRVKAVFLHVIFRTVPGANKEAFPVNYAHQGTLNML
jgi:hypothetical protein